VTESPTADPVELAHLIAGEHVGNGAGGSQRFNPARPGELVAISPQADAATVDAAIGAAAAAAPTWRATPAPARGRILTRAAELLMERHARIARDLCREEGKTLAEAGGEVTRAADILRFHGGEGWRAGGETLPTSVTGTLLYTVREPLGVVGLITPWNFPIAIPAWKLAPALVVGNAVVMKPSGLTGLTATHLARALVDAGLPAGVLNVVLGAGRVAGVALVDDPRVAAISFTGSTVVGLGIQAAAAPRLARTQLEMGGKNALVVLDDADPARAASIAAAGGFGLTGQACTATSRVICTPGIHDAFVQALAAEARAYAPGDGQEEGVRMGPVVSEDQLATNLDHLGGAQAAGAKLAAGGSHDALRFEPAVFAGVTPDMAIAREEVFGPVIAVLEVADLDEAISLVNDSAYGLTAGIATNDLAAVTRFADAAEVGVVKVNQSTTGLELNAPFGGVKQSSTDTFREQGSGAVDFYTRTKTVYVRS
jgi:acyl-CoA reductase-like NAD-dependent aldehyde dehydrogenase